MARIGKTEYAVGHQMFFQGRLALRSHAGLLGEPESSMVFTSYKSNTEGTYERLRADLLSCRLKPGERLSINKLCVEFAVSLGAVREALSRLTSEGLVVAQPQRGFRAAPISASELQNLTDALVDMETICIRRAFAQGDIAWEARVLSAYHQLSRAPTAPADAIDDPVAQAHCRFRDELVSACGNPQLLRLREMLIDQAERYRSLARKNHLNVRNAERQQRQLVDAVMARDVEKAVTLLTRHQRSLEQRLLETIETELAGAHAPGRRGGAGTAGSARKPTVAAKPKRPTTTPKSRAAS